MPSEKISASHLIAVVRLMDKTYRDMKVFMSPKEDTITVRIFTRRPKVDVIINKSPSFYRRRAQRALLHHQNLFPSSFITTINNENITINSAPDVLDDIQLRNLNDNLRLDTLNNYAFMNKRKLRRIRIMEQISAGTYEYKNQNMPSLSPVPAIMPVMINYNINYENMELYMSMPSYAVPDPPPARLNILQVPVRQPTVPQENFQQDIYEFPSTERLCLECEFLGEAPGFEHDVHCPVGGHIPQDIVHVQYNVQHSCGLLPDEIWARERWPDQFPPCPCYEQELFPEPLGSPRF